MFYPCVNALCSYFITFPRPAPTVPTRQELSTRSKSRSLSLIKGLCLYPVSLTFLWQRRDIVTVSRLLSVRSGKAAGLGGRCPKVKSPPAASATCIRERAVGRSYWKQSLLGEEGRSQRRMLQHSSSLQSSPIKICRSLLPPARQQSTKVRKQKTLKTTFMFSI